MEGAPANSDPCCNHTKIGVSESFSPRSRGQVEPCDFCVRSGDFSRLGVQDGQECPFENRNVAAIMLTMPGRVAGDHLFLTLFAKILLQVVSPTVKVSRDTALFAGKCPCLLSPLERGVKGYLGAGPGRSPLTL